MAYAASFATRLSSKGYTVLEATNGLEALDTAAHYSGVIHLLLIHAVMPEIRAVTLALRFAEIRPGVPVLHMSGFSDSALQPDSPDTFIQKPFTPAALLIRVQQMLRANPTGTPNQVIRVRMNRLGGCRCCLSTTMPSPSGKSN